MLPPLCACVHVQMFQKTGRLAVAGMRATFDRITGYGPNMTEVRGAGASPCTACEYALTSAPCDA